MTETHVSYAPGDWTLLARGGRYLLVQAAPVDEPVGRLWTVLADGEPEAVLAAVAAELPAAGFCLVQIDDDGVRLAQRGVASLLDGRAVEATESLAPVDVPGVGGMIVASTTGGSAGLQIPIEGGVVGAGALIVVQVGDEEPAAAPEPPPEASPELEDVLPPADAPPSTANTQIWDDVPEFDPGEETALDLDLSDLPPPVPGTAVDPRGPINAPPPVPGTAAASAAPVTDGSETVLAAICLNGHVSGANAPTCRVCGEAMPPQSPRTIARPSLGMLVLQDGTTVDLDRSAVLGRAPRVPDDATERPHLVNLAAYGRDVSRQHAEVVVQGWSVSVRDLGSANGTRVHDPIGRITVLQPGVAVPLEPDSLIDISDVTMIQYRTV